MSHIRFNHVFALLMLACGAAAFLVPSRYAGRVRGRVDAVLAPVALPVRHLAHAISARLAAAPPGLSDTGADASVAARAEVENLRAAVASLTVQLAEMRRLAGARELAGDAHRYSVPLRVIGAEDGPRHVLLLRAGAEDGIAPGMPAVWRDSLVGRITSAGGGSARLRLVTDRGFRASAAFGTFRAGADGTSVEFVAAATPPPLVEGRGDGLLAAANLTCRQLEEAGVKPGHWAVLRDADDWPLLVNGYVLGQVEHIAPQSSAKLFAEVLIRPKVNARQLREVMVVTGTERAAAGAPAPGRSASPSGQRAIRPPPR